MKSMPSDMLALKKMEDRLARLEEAVFGKNTNRQQAPTASHFSGATGGVRFLISKNYFSTKRKLGEVRSSLAENGYHYSKQTVHMALQGLAARKGPLTLIKEGGGNFYVNRK